MKAWEREGICMNVEEIARGQDSREAHDYDATRQENGMDDEDTLNYYGEKGWV